MISNKPTHQQEKDLIDTVSKNPNITFILDNQFFPQHIPWYLGAGAISQTVWNQLSGNKLTDNIKDYDLIYYDPSDISYEAEDVYIQKGKNIFKSLSAEVEIRNQARVHLWFESKFGCKISPLKSCEDAINGWPTTATTVGINKINNTINIYAPYGLNDLFGMVVRPNKQSIIEKEVYENKVNKWTQSWPNLKVIPWEKT